MKRQRPMRCPLTAEQYTAPSATVFAESCYQVAGLALPTSPTRHPRNRFGRSGLRMLASVPRIIGGRVSGNRFSSACVGLRGAVRPCKALSPRAGRMGHESSTKAEPSVLDAGRTASAPITLATVYRATIPGISVQERRGCISSASPSMSGSLPGLGRARANIASHRGHLWSPVAS